MERVWQFVRALGFHTVSESAESQREFRRVVPILDICGRKVDKWRLAIPFNELTEKRFAFELENFWNFVIVAGGDLRTTFATEMNTTELASIDLSLRLSEKKSVYRARELQKEKDVLTSYQTVLETLYEWIPTAAPAR
jgi:hypothetical protein